MCNGAQRSQGSWTADLTLFIPIYATHSDTFLYPFTPMLFSNVRYGPYQS